MTTPKITRQQLAVLELVAVGHSNREIADKLVVAENTVKVHVREIGERFFGYASEEGVNRLVLVRIAARLGLIDLNTLPIRGYDEGKPAPEPEPVRWVRLEVGGKSYRVAVEEA